MSDDIKWPDGFNPAGYLRALGDIIPGTTTAPPEPCREVEYEEDDELTGPTETDFVEYMKHLHQLEKQGERAPAYFGPYTAIVVIGALQLAMRHPEMKPVQLEAIQSIIDQFHPWFAGTLGETMIIMGNNPEFDR